MKDDYSFFCMVDEGSSHDTVRRVPLTADLQIEITTHFETLASTFYAHHLEAVVFDGGFSADEDHVFEIADFTLPEAIVSAAKGAHQVDPLRAEEIKEFRVKAIFATRADGRGSVAEVLFQLSDKSAVLSKNRTLIFGPERFQKISDTGLTLGNRLCAVYRQKSLRFFSYSNASRVLDLTSVFKEATNSEIVEVLSNNIFGGLTAPGLVTQVADQWMRRRFTILRTSGALTSIADPYVIKSGAEKYKIDVQVQNGKVVFPTDKAAAKKLLRYLSEEFYDGVITGNPYMTNSKRQLKV